MARPGPKTSLTPEIQRLIIETIRAGNYRTTACQRAGIHRDTLNHWEHRAKSGEEPFVSFVAELSRAEAEGEVELLAAIREGEPGWQGKAWIMERRFAKRWSGRVRQTVAEELGVLTDKLRKGLDRDTYEKVIDVTSREDVAEAATADPHH